MKTIIIAFIMIFMVCLSCTLDTTPTGTVQETPEAYSIDTGFGAGSVNVVVIDGCQYLKTYVHGGCCLAHKGNCNSPIHRVR